MHQMAKDTTDFFSQMYGDGIDIPASDEEGQWLDDHFTSDKPQSEICSVKSITDTKYGNQYLTDYEC